MRTWKSAFSATKYFRKNKENLQSLDVLAIDNMEELKYYLDLAHIREALLRPYFETKDYPLVEARTLLPSFEPSLYEYKELPGFSLVVLDRPLSSFSEPFQYDFLYPSADIRSIAEGPCCLLDQNIIRHNLLTILAKMPRQLHDNFRKEFQQIDITALELYPHMLSYILEMDRAHVIAKSSYNHFQLSGIFASLPSNIDGELKRFGLRINKFYVSDNELYEHNRFFVMQYLMELYGFPISSERRTSAALFSRYLHRSGERFLIRVLGQSDRTLTTIWNDGSGKRYPHVEKICLIRIEKEQKDLIEFLKSKRAFVDAKQHVALVRVTYIQHAFNSKNVRQDRALSIINQQIIHPMTGKNIDGLSIIRDAKSIILNLNDIVRGEHTGRIIYKRTELIENTDTEEKRLKFLFAWLNKHQRRIISYSDDFFSNISNILESYFAQLADTDQKQIRELLQENRLRYSYIQQARKLRYLEEIKTRNFKGKRLTYLEMLTESVCVLQELRFELVHYFDDLTESALHFMDSIIYDHYLCKTYIGKPDHLLTKAGIEICQKYKKLIQIKDDFQSIKKVYSNDTETP